MREELKSLALKLVGCPYVWGGANPWTGFDCSGFVIWCYQVFAILPAGDWTAQGLYDYFRAWPEGHETPGQTGILYFYGRDLHRVTHVMMGLDGGLVVGASGGDSTTTTVEEARRRGACVKVKPAGYRADLLTTVKVYDAGA